MSTNNTITNLIEHFSIDNLIHFFRSKTRTFSQKNISIHIDSDEFSEGKQVGEFKTDISEIVVYCFKVNKPLSERSGKKAQYELAKKILKQEQRYATGIFVFYDDKGDFRFSLVYDIISPQGKRNWSNFRRFTYFVSKEQTNKTFIQQIGKADFSTLDKIKEAFSVEPVTKQFYNEIQNWYFWAMDKVKFPEDYKYSEDSNKDKEIRNATSLIRLITRIIFIWFLKEKGLIPSDLFSSEKLKKIVKDFMIGTRSSNYYNAILQNLFFGTLNQKMNERKFANESGYPANKKEYGIKNLYRYADKFLINKDEILALFKDIPFLNGGLFDCLDKEDESNRVIYIDGFSRNPKKQAIIPDYLFFQQDEIKVDLSSYKLGKNKPVRGFIEILSSYNFIIDENIPIDQEVALDPELLGKVFENLLASYNPETATTARKATGSYYTPREIVDYMVEESLFEYLKGRLPEIDQEKIKLLLSYSDDNLDFSEEEKEKTILAIDEIKILDPACGSGAFPMGILHKLVYALQRLDPENSYWKELQRQKAQEESKEVFEQDDKNQREERLREINETFDESINYPDYARKLYLIENCIYGVDIQPIAIQISKLRFFISLVLDQKIDKNKENFGIRPLPNLETKFVAANTLIGLDKPDHLFYTNEIKQLENEIKSLRHKYFTAKSRREKLDCQTKDKKLREKLAEELKSLGFSSDSSQKIAKFDLYDQNTSADWFDPEWMFGVTEGFDIVIGNPPYVSTKGVSEENKKILEQQFGFADDLYAHFIFKGFDLLKDNGIISYITSKTYWTIQTKKNVRELLSKNKIIEMFDTATPFTAMVDTAVFIAEKQKDDSNYEFVFKDGKDNLLNPVEYKAKIEWYKNIPNNVFFIPNEKNLKIQQKYGAIVKKLIDTWWDKISTSKNIVKYKRELENYRNSLKPGDITLLGLITEGGQGLATANNGKYIGVLDGTKWAEKVITERPKKLWEFVQNKKPKELVNIKSLQDSKELLKNKTEYEIRKLFDKLKEKYGRDIFGQGWLYKVVNQDEIADVEKLTEDEKLNGIERIKTFVPYDKGDKEGNRWYAPTPYYIDWSKEKVKFLKENSGKKGEGMPVVRNPQFYFREGFCWTDVNSIYLKSRIKQSGIYDVLTMSLFSKINIPDLFFVCIINSKLISEWVSDFINLTSHFQINDARQLPIIIPTQEQLKTFKEIFDKAVSIQKQRFAGLISKNDAEIKLQEIQKILDKEVEELYGI